MMMEDSAYNNNNHMARDISSPEASMDISDNSWLLRQLAMNLLEWQKITTVKPWLLWICMIITLVKDRLK